jgi:hypothetical protein
MEIEHRRSENIEGVHGWLVELALGSNEANEEDIFDYVLYFL